MTTDEALGNISIEDLAWLAGYIDGDGCVTMTPSKGRFKYPRLSIDSCDIELLEEVKRITGIQRVKAKTLSKISKRKCYTFIIEGTRALQLLILVEPRLRCLFKKARAKLLIENQDLYTKSKGASFTEEEAKRRLSIEKQFFEMGADRGSRNRAYSVLSSKQVAVAEVKTLVQI